MKIISQKKTLKKKSGYVLKNAVNSFLFIVSTLFILPGNVSAQEKREKEIAIVKYDKGEYGAKRQTVTRCLAKAVKEATGNEADLVSEDIFLPENRGKRDSYKRILIPRIAIWFTPKIYEGMTEYVKDGGLLITNAAMSGRINEDKQGAKSHFGKAGNPLVGVRGHSAVQMTKIMVKVNCPLTEGLSFDNWIDLETKPYGRRTTNRNATALIVSDSLYKGKLFNQPFLTYKHLGKGACIYIVPAISTKSKYISLIFKNVLSSKTLEWLTAGDTP